MPLVFAPRNGQPPPKWWKMAHALLVIADEASIDCGYALAGDDTAAWFNNIAAILLQISTDRRVISDTRHVSRHVALDTLCSSAARNVARVLPKGRTTELGCTSRTLSHNLALTPPYGQITAYWHQPESHHNMSARGTMNLLLVPFPYVLQAGSFVGTCHCDRSDPWGRFQIRQTWLCEQMRGRSPRYSSTRRSRKSFCQFIGALLKRSKEMGHDINGIVLPEYALDFKAYDALVRYIRNTWRSIELVISGVSGDCTNHAGNFVIFTVFHNTPDGRIAATHSRRKHHRWRLDRSQIEIYGLQDELDPERTWWEYLEIQERVLHLDLFRDRSAFTAVICEDLARVDPGLSLLRSIGPNLVFAILLDGPQLKARWPGLYASTLADDPGSAVLTLTSLAFVNRSNENWKAKNGGATKRVVAQWKSRPRLPAANDWIELDLDKRGQALIVELHSEQVRDITIDGRVNPDTIAWYYDTHKTVALSHKILSGRDWNWILDPV